MPITVNITDEGLGFIMKGEGAITGKEILAGIDERFSSEDQTKKYLYGLSDYTEVTSIDMTTNEIKYVAAKDEYVSKLNPDLVMAIAAPEDIMYGLSRMFAGYAFGTGWEIDVHRDLQNSKKAILSK